MSSAEASAPNKAHATPPHDSAEKEAWELLNNGQAATALNAFEAVLARCPASPGALQGKVASLRKQRHFSEAAAALDAALTSHPHEIGLLGERAWLWFDQKRDDQAIIAFDAVLATGRADEGIHLWKISLLRAARRYREAEEAIAAARRVFPDSTRLPIEAAWLMFDEKAYDDAIAAFDRVLATTPAEPSAWQGKIATLRKCGYFVDAETTANAGLKSCPGDPGILVERGWVAFDQGLFERAEKAFGQAVTSAPDDPRIKVCVALSLIRQGGEAAFVIATTALRDALAIDPNLADAHGCLGVIAFKRGRFGEAENRLLRSTQIDTRRGAFVDLGALYAQMGRMDEARTCFKQAITNDPDNAYAHIQMGSLLLHDAKNRAALDEFRMALAIDPGNPEAHNALAVGLIECDRVPEAEMTLRSALRKLDIAKRPGICLALCQLLVRMGDDSGEIRFYEEALAQAGAALIQKPRDAAAHFSKGVARYKLGDLPGALTCFKQCLRYDHDHVQAGLNSQRIKVMLTTGLAPSRRAKLASLLLSLVLLAQVVILWWYYLNTDRINPAVFAALVPLLLGMMIVTILLPSLSRLKVTGLEADLSVSKPKDSLPSGPQGAVGFGDPSPRST